MNVLLQKNGSKFARNIFCHPNMKEKCNALIIIRFSLDMRGWRRGTNSIYSIKSSKKHLAHPIYVYWLVQTVS